MTKHKKTGDHCANPRHPDGPFHEAEPIPGSWELRKRLTQWLRKRKYGCVCPRDYGTLADVNFPKIKDMTK